MPLQGMRFEFYISNMDSIGGLLSLGSLTPTSSFCDVVLRRFF